MKLKKLIKNIAFDQVKGSKELEITGLTVNSKYVSPGNLFIAKKGRSQDGVHFVPEAINAGATAILTDIYDPSLKNVTQLIHHDVSSMEALLAATFYQFPSQELLMVAITGTNGKTTTSFLVKHLLDKKYGLCGLVGTIENIIGENRYQAKLTTPDVAHNHKLLREMCVHECKACVMEVTSHALDQGRVKHVDFDIAIFTNLTQDHLDYHRDMESYCSAKNKLFLSLNSPSSKKGIKKAIVNIDSPWHEKITQGCNATLFTYAIENRNADLFASDIVMKEKFTSFMLNYQGKKFPCKSPLIGRFNIYNVLAALSVGIAKDIPIEELIDALASFKSVSGRLELVPNALNLNIFVDFAHSDDALKNVLLTLREIKDRGKIITVFGCGGDRDNTKRPKMGKVAEELSDAVIITSDNPRSEDPSTIIQQIEKGFLKKEYVVEVDREKAIEKAIEMASPKDVILIAGKGHEAYQIFANQTIPFDDRKKAASICESKAHTRGIK